MALPINIEDIRTGVTSKSNPQVAHYVRSNTSSIIAKGEVLDELRNMGNRTLHIRWNEPLRQNDVLKETKRQNDVLETPLSLSERLSVTSPVGISTSTQFQTVIYAPPTVAVGTKDGVDAINDVTNRLKVKLTDRQMVMFNIIAESPTITIKRMSEMLSVTQRSVARDISVLKNAGIIIRKGKKMMKLGE